MSGRRSNVTLDQYRRLVEVRKLRQQVPCNKTLSRELGLPVHAVTNAIARGIKRYDAVLAKEAKR